MFYYRIDEFDEKAREIQKENRRYIYQLGTAYTPWYNYKKFYQEKKALIVQSQDMFLSYKIPVNLQTMNISVAGVLNYDGQFVVTCIMCCVDLLKYITPKDISDIFDKLGMFRFSRPLVYDRKLNTDIKGWDKIGYHALWTDDDESKFQRVISFLP